MHFFSAKKCDPLDGDNPPDLGTDTGSTHDWTEAITIHTQITYRCPEGQAFNETYLQEVTSNCTGTPALMFWEYNTTRPLPTCVRE